MQKTYKLRHMQTTTKVIIAGGGTGGHVFPAIAIGRALKNKPYNAQVLFVGAKGRMEMEKVPQAGFDIIGLSVAGIQRRVTWKNLLVPFKLINSMIQSRRIIRRIRPDVVIGVGGYASGPLVRAAANMGIPTLIQEQNSYPGLTNRLLAKKAKKICVAYEGMERYFDKSKLYLTGNPVRQDIFDIDEKREAAIAHFGLNTVQHVVLVIGGSLGAKSINEAIASRIEELTDNGIQLLWQTGISHYQETKTLLGDNEIKGVSVLPFIDRMDLAYAAADLVISRAGAIAVSELCVAKKPAILIPSPNVAEDHQTKNAQALVDNQAAYMIKDQEASKLLAPKIIELVADEEKKQRLTERIASLAYRNAAELIAEVAMGLVKKTL